MKVKNIYRKQLLKIMKMESGELVYEDEIVLAEQVDKGRDDFTPKQGESITLFHFFYKHFL